MKEYKTLSPFKLLMLQNFPYIEADFDALTNYQLMCKIVEYLNNVINNQIAVQDNVTYLYDEFVKLKNYVETYFNNLDVQNEINNKLDELVADGTLAEIINEQLFTELNNKYKRALTVYENILDMKQDTNITLGQTIYVKGLTTSGDGFSAYYNILDAAEENSYYVIKLDNNLYAVMQNEIENNFYSNIYYEVERHNSTNCYFTYIPKYDNDNNLIVPYVADNNSLTPNEYAIKNNTNITINASLAIEQDEQFVDASAIGSGKILRDYNIPNLEDKYVYIAFKNNREITTYQANVTTAQDMINDGVIDAFLCFGQYVKDGVFTQGTNYLEPGPGQYLGLKANGDIVLLTNDGRNVDNVGLTGEDGCNLLINKGCLNVWILDGGGSTSTSFRSNKINMNVDSSGTVDRKISYLLNVKKTIVNKPTADIYSYIGQFKQLFNKQLMGLINDKQSLIGTLKIKNKNAQVVNTNNQELVLFLSSPSNRKLFNFDVDSSNSVTNIKLKNKGYFYINAIFQVQNNDESTDRNIYLDIMQGDTAIFTIGASLKPKEFKPLSISDAFLVDTTIDLPIHIQVRSSFNSVVQVTRCDVSYTAYKGF